MSARLPFSLTWDLHLCPLCGDPNPVDEARDCPEQVEHDCIPHTLCALFEQASADLTPAPSDE